ncbi:entry exclusion lipoprotein TrbK [Gilliamella sp. HK2]|uniref:entry exclusion lipoprotein TrbK n=1 Tax=unclassified Gilliamella TaxID=2685620 RepID=UPI00080ED771|nr:entry exclusion lipoprotein TrbK [Gilliamella apicola]OCG28981.1 entry exclusion lipoprotein TrbK [Gilliamella apicola]OCG31454.1 entry exclusion lipoprotein TrbK [Gilliamella apicola]
MIKLLVTGLLTLMILSGCEQKETTSQIQCSDYAQLTDENAKKELKKRCPTTGSEKIKQSTNNKNDNGIISNLESLP